MNKIYKHLSHSLFLCISPSLIKVSCGPHFYISSTSHKFLMYRYKNLTQGVFTNLVVVYERQHSVAIQFVFTALPIFNVIVKIIIGGGKKTKQPSEIVPLTHNSCRVGEATHSSSESVCGRRILQAAAGCSNHRQDQQE